MSNTRNTLFTIITVVVIPLLFFVVVEFALRLMGVGTHYQYFNQIDIDGEAFYQENPDFADQFYPPSLNVGPLQNTFAAERSDDRLRVFVWVVLLPWASRTKIMASIVYWLPS